MAKRRAEKQLNKDDADVDDEVEDSGEFQKANSNIIANRVIRTAKRRNPDSSGQPSPLANFSGFSTAPKNAPFSFFGKPNNTNIETTPTTSKTVNTDSNLSKSRDMDYLKALNLSCSSWIQQHLEKNPYVVLLPVFRDYEKHLASLNLDTGPATSTASVPSSNVPSLFSFNGDNNSNTASKNTLSFGFDSKKESNDSKSENNIITGEEKSNREESKTVTATTFSFGINPTTKSSLEPIVSLSSSKTSPGMLFKPETSTAFSFGSDKTTSALAPAKGEQPTFSFGLKNGPSASSTQGSALSFFSKQETSNAGTVGSQLTGSPLAPPSTAPAANDEPSDEPPQFNFVPVAEEGSVFEIRCKVFFKKDGSFASVGVGTLYLKSVAGGKTQLITRADTTQGSVLLNLLLTPDLPLQRTGKNNVLLVCVPTPDAKPPPVPVLIRVKSAEERDSLLSEMERLRGC